MGSLLWAACTPPPATAQPFASRPTTPSPKPHWQEFEASQHWPAATPSWFEAEGHYGGGLEALVKVTPKALAQYQQHTSGTVFEPGTTLVMLHRSRVTRKPGPVHAMKRGETTWEYWKLTAEGAIESQGALPLCARCHADAPGDSVFGPPRVVGVKSTSRPEPSETSQVEPDPQE